jgi:hypothetical protein
MLKRLGCVFLLPVVWTGPIVAAPAFEAAPPVVVMTPPAAAPRVPLPDTPARRAAALKLAQSAQTMETLKIGAVRGFAQGLRHVAAGPGGLAEIEKKYPGFTEELIKRGSPAMAREIGRVGPDLWRRMADIYVAELTDDELARYIAFYSSPTGGKLMRLINENADVDPLIKDLEQTGEMSVNEHEHVVDKAAAASIGALSADELIAVLRFNAENKATNERVAPKVMLAVSEWQKQVDDGPISKEIGEMMATLIADMDKQVPSKP